MSALLHWQTAVDFIVLAVALYAVLRWATEARAVRVALGVIALLSGSLAARAHRLPVTRLVLEAAAFLVVAAVDRLPGRSPPCVQAPGYRAASRSA